MLVTNNTKVAQLRCFLSNLLHWCVQMSASTRPFRGTSSAVLSNHPEHWSLHFTCSSSDLMRHHRCAQTLVKFDLCSFSLSAVEGGGCSRCNPHPHHHYSLVHPNESLCYHHHHHHSCHGNLAWGFGGMCGIAGDWLLGARCFPIKPVTGVCGSLPPHHHEGRRERERAQLWQTVLFCYGDV